MLRYSSVFGFLVLLVSSAIASPSRKFHAEPAQLTPRPLPSKVEVRDVATTTSRSDRIVTNICRWVGGDPGV